MKAGTTAEGAGEQSVANAQIIFRDYLKLILLHIECATLVIFTSLILKLKK